MFKNYKIAGLFGNKSQKPQQQSNTAASAVNFVRLSKTDPDMPAGLILEAGAKDAYQLFCNAQLQAQAQNTTTPEVR